MLMISIAGTELTVPEATLLTENKNKIAGIILFTKNYINKDQLKLLTQSIKNINQKFIIAVDHEGGKIWRFTDGFTLIPKPSEYLNFNQTLESGQVMAEELLQCGVDLSFAPVLDSYNKDSQIIAKYGRSFGENNNNQQIYELSLGFITGMHKAGMKVCAKHFPDHGFCSGDSHLELPIDNRTEQEIFDYLNKVYNPLIDQNLLDYIMPAHVMYPSLDLDYPATLSKVILQDILREKLGYKGIIISDCFAMGALQELGKSKNMNLADQVNYALTIGHDIVILCHQSVDFINDLLVKNESHRTINNINRSVV